VPLALAIMLFTIVASGAIGVTAAKLKVKALRADTYIVAGRALGTLVYFLNAAAAIYSGYTFLGGAGFSYKFGAAAIFMWATSLLGYVVGYITAPYIWSTAKKNNLLTLSDYIMWRYQSKLLMVLVAIISVIFNVPYVQLQIRSVSILLGISSGDTIPALHVAVFSFLLVVLYVFLGGMVSVAITNVFFGALMLATMFGGSLAVILKYFGGLPGLYSAVEAVSPQHVTLGLKSEAWFISTVIGTALNFWLWSTRIQVLYTARDVKVIRRGMALLSWYIILGTVWITHIGLATRALGLRLEDPDYAFARIVNLAYGDIALGLVAAGGAAASLSTAAAILLDQSSSTVRNIYEPITGRRLGDRELVYFTRILIIIYSVISTILAYTQPSLLVDLYLLSASGVLQLFPALVMGIFWRSLSKYEIIPGLLAGEVVVVYLYKSEPLGVAPMMWGLLANISVLLLVHVARRTRLLKAIHQLNSALKLHF
jgi:SSS family solute:Na+ symporter